MILILVLILLKLVLAEEFVRKVELEWERDDRALSYELEVENVTNLKIVLQKKVKENQATFFLRPGLYRYRIRSYDKRGIAGPWSDYEEFQIKFPPIVVTNPKNGEKLPSKELHQDRVLFSWEAHPDIDEVSIKIRTEDAVEGIQKTWKRRESPSSQLLIELSVGKAYVATISAKNEASQVTTKEDSQLSFVLLGGELKPPTMKETPNAYARALKWTCPSPAQKARIYWKDLPSQPQFSPNREQSLSPQSGNDYQFPLPLNWPGGRYEASIHCEAPFYIPSRPKVLVFDLKEGDRSEEAEKIFRRRESLEPSLGWFSQWRYSVALLTYRAQRPILGGTSYLDIDFTTQAFQAQVGYLAGMESWSYLFQLEWLQFHLLKNDLSLNSNALGAAVMRKLPWGLQGDLRWMAGVMQRYYPVLNWNPNNFVILNHLNLSSFGPWVGVDWAHALTAEWAIFAQFQIFGGLANHNPIPGGSEARYQLFQLNATALYRWRKNHSFGLGWYYRREDVAADWFSPFLSGWLQSQLDGHFWSGIYEWYF